MRLPEIQLDDRRFQDLVSEARLRITRSCPEWTEHNVSDPGITLIELFAWMTEMTIYRLNRVPDKLHVTLLELLGIQARRPERGARPSLRFRLAEPPTRAAADPRRRDRGRHAAHRATTSRSSSRSTRTSRSPPLRPAAYVLQRGGQVKDVGVADGEARPQGADQLAVRQPAGGRRRALPRLRGAARPAARSQVDVDASQARGAGVNPEDPPLRWEVSQGDDEWDEAIVLEDLTGGFNYGSGTVELELPPRSAIAAARRPPHALAALPDRRQDAPRRRRDDLHAARRRSTRSPPRRSARCCPPRTPRRSSARSLGVSDGTPGQVFPLRYHPVLKPGAGRDARGPGPGVRRLGALGAARRTSSARPSSTATSSLDLVSGEVELGPAIRETDGGWTQYGAVPPKGAVLRFTRYRHGGGRDGNVTAGTLTRAASARSPASTRSPTRSPAIGGVDAETLDARAPARVDGDPHRATAPSPPRTSSSWPARRRPRVARAVCIPPRRRRRRCRCTSSRASTRPTASSTYDELVPDEDAAARRSPSTSTSAA